MSDWHVVVGPSNSSMELFQYQLLVFVPSSVSRGLYGESSLISHGAMVDDILQVIVFNSCVVAIGLNRTDDMLSIANLNRKKI